MVDRILLKALKGHVIRIFSICTDGKGAPARVTNFGPSCTCTYTHTFSLTVTNFGVIHHGTRNGPEGSIDCPPPAYVSVSIPMTLSDLERAKIFSGGPLLVRFDPIPRGGAAAPPPQKGPIYLTPYDKTVSKFFMVIKLDKGKINFYRVNHVPCPD